MALPLRCAASLRLAEQGTLRLAVSDREWVGDPEKRQTRVTASRRLARASACQRHNQSRLLCFSFTCNEKTFPARVGRAIAGNPNR